MTRSLLVLAVAVGCACGSKLRDVPSPVLEVRPEPVDRFGPTPDIFMVRLSYDLMQGCVSLSGDVRGTVNGVDVGEIFRGEEHPGTLLSPTPSCVFPGFQLPLEVADAPEVTVAFEDGEDRIAGTFRNLGTPPAMTVTPPADGHIRVGATIGLDWMPVTADIRGLQVVLSNTNDPSSFALLSGATFHDAHGELIIPTNYKAGPSLLQVFGKRQASVVSCTTTCRAEIDMGIGSLPVFNEVRLSMNVEP